MTQDNVFCRFVGWMHRKCAGVRDGAELPLRFREASHALNNEVQLLHGQAQRVKRSMDELNDLVSHMQEDDK